MESAQEESRVERSTVALTKREKQAVRFVAIHRQTTESEMLRETLIADIVVEYDRLTAALEQVAEPEATAA